MNTIRKWLQHLKRQEHVLQFAGLPGETEGTGDWAGPGTSSDRAEAGDAHLVSEPSEATTDHETAAAGTADDRGLPVLPVELQYIVRLIRYRLGLEFHSSVLLTEPVMPPYENWDLPLGAFIRNYPVENPETIGPDEAKLLLIALVHHVQPDLFDQAIDSMLKGAGDFPKVGGTRGKNFRGFMPTGETALFLLAGDDWKKRLTIQRLFWADHLFARKKILWLEEIAPGEPAMSGKITLSQDYVDLFTQNRTIPPHFGMSFPARLVTTDRKREDLVVNSHLNAQIEDLLDWIRFNKGLAGKEGRDGRFRNGYRVLFYGPSGTGKTFAACILGNETGKEVYRVDLSMVVSKYIGETEKNLEMLFARAENKKWILFFDEADSLFGKRTSVRDAHDKYANQEVSYLLQRIEDYDGLVILATNMKNNIDDAFIRRFNAILRFPMPDQAERKKIWEKTFPPGVRFAERLEAVGAYVAEVGRGAAGDGGAGSGPEAAGRPFDMAEAVKKYELSGGNIVNIVHYASIKGAKRQQEQGQQALTIYLPDVIDGIRLELGKNGIPFPFKR